LFYTSTQQNATENNQDTEIIIKITKSERIKTELELQLVKKITVTITKSEIAITLVISGCYVVLTFGSTAFSTPAVW